MANIILNYVAMSNKVGTYSHSSTIFIKNNGHVNLPNAELSKKIPDRH